MFISKQPSEAPYIVKNYKKIDNVYYVH